MPSALDYQVSIALIKRKFGPEVWAIIEDFLNGLGEQTAVLLALLEEPDEEDA